MQRVSYSSKVVMAGLDPAIHVLAASIGRDGERVDARVKPAHDDPRLVTIGTQQPVSFPRTALREGRNDELYGMRSLSTIYSQALMRCGERGRGHGTICAKSYARVLSDQI